MKVFLKWTSNKLKKGGEVETQGLKSEFKGEE